MKSCRIWFPTSKEINEADESSLKLCTERVEKKECWAERFILVAIVATLFILLRMFIGLPFLQGYQILFELGAILAIPLLALLGFYMFNRAAWTKRAIRERRKRLTSCNTCTS